MLRVVLHGLDCNVLVANRPEQRSLQKEETVLHVQTSHSAINQLMFLGSKPCKAVLLGVCVGSSEEQVACLCLPLQVLFF